jgi:hypothetical protein
MSKSNELSNFEPLRLWSEWYQKSEKSWNEAVTNLLGDDRVAKSTGKYLQEAMHAQRMFTDAMAKYLANLNLPSRSDVLALSDRVGKVEDALAGLQVEIRQLRRTLTERGLASSEESPPLRPKRTRRPPKQE